MTPTTISAVCASDETFVSIACLYLDPFTAEYTYINENRTWLLIKEQH